MFATPTRPPPSLTSSVPCLTYSSLTPGLPASVVHTFPPYLPSFHQVIWPFSSGEVILQNYNAVLSLAHLYPVSDGVMLFENDRIQKVQNVRQFVEHKGNGSDLPMYIA